MTEHKRQILPPGLWVVATPIGNLDDLTPRARQALELADTILCEDTRRTATLLSALGLQRPPRGLKRFDAHSSPESIRKLVESMQSGENFALVTDAGTPGVSDPGAALVAEARASGVRVTPLPGVSAVSAFLSVAGFQGSSFVFRGFFPRKEGERAKELELARRGEAARIWLWFESPQRIAPALAFLAGELSEGAESPLAQEGRGPRLVAAKELTKVYEKIFSGSPDEVAQAVSREVSLEGEKGEWVFALGPGPDDSGPRVPSDSESGAESSDWVKALRCLLDVSVPASEAARRVSQVFGRPKKLVYERALKLSGKKA